MPAMNKEIYESRLVVVLIYRQTKLHYSTLFAILLSRHAEKMNKSKSSTLP